MSGLTIKEQLIQEIQHMSENSSLITVERLATGERNEMTFYCSKEELLEIIDSNFNDDLIGKVPGGVDTKINGWDIVDLDDLFT